MCLEGALWEGNLFLFYPPDNKIILADWEREVRSLVCLS